MKNSSYTFKDNTYNFGQRIELSGSKKKKKVIEMRDGPEATYKIGNATVRIHGKVDSNKLKEVTVDFLKSVEKQKKDKEKEVVEKGA